jgi:hypothetical protein
MRAFLGTIAKMPAGERRSSLGPGVLLLLAACATHSEGKSEIHGGDCASCHTDESAKTADPPHLQARFGSDCGSCHNELSWQPAPGFMHTSGFALTLGHADLVCSECHAAGYVPGKIPNQCVDCHGAKAALVADPVHAGLDTNCFACHRTDAFKPAHFVHSWPLKGKHELLTCGSCHPGNPASYETTSPACVSCHAADRARADATIADHMTFATTCQDCHGFDKF